MFHFSRPRNVDKIYSGIFFFLPEIDSPFIINLYLNFWEAISSNFSRLETYKHFSTFLLRRNSILLLLSKASLKVFKSKFLNRRFSFLLPVSNKFILQSKEVFLLMSSTKKNTSDFYLLSIKTHYFCDLKDHFFASSLPSWSSLSLFNPLQLLCI